MYLNFPQNLNTGLLEISIGESINIGLTSLKTF